ncbi:hypothetical protein H6785_00835 [Candidatus Nomurabacteria bacterium]|nr:hypothetical protein [Candidatus Nomurabacteria bacterium]
MNEPKLVEVRHLYPFLYEHGIDFRDDSLDTRYIGKVVVRFISDYVRNCKGGKKEFSDPLEFLLGNMVNDYGKLFNFKEEIISLDETLQNGEEASLQLPLINVGLRLKKFGQAVAFRTSDSNGEVHRKATETMERLLSDQGLHGWRPFVKERLITTSCWRDDIAEQLTIMAGYIPDVNWYISTASDVAACLHEDYVTGGQGWPVGLYHDIPVYMKVIDGKKETDVTWRRGALKYDGRTTLEFSRESNCDPEVQFSVRMFAPAEYSGAASDSIDYWSEQYHQRDLSSVILNALKARNLASVISRNPVRWRKE